MISILELKDIHAGRPGAVLGGGPSLKKDLKQIPKDVILIAVNHHGLGYGHMDYTVFLDDVPSLRISFEELRARGGVLVSRQPESDVDLGGPDWWQGRFSGQLACWLACWMGCNPVLLCGADCYQNPIPPDEDPRNLAYQKPLAEHLAGWKEAFIKCPHPERIRAISGPLVEIFGKFQFLGTGSQTVSGRQLYKIG
jgi:hypothetical protein